MTSELASLDDLRLSLVGPGRVGSSMAHWAVACGAKLTRVSSRSRQSARILTEELGGRPTTLTSLETVGEELLLIAVPDPDLQSVTRELADRPQAKVVLHTSGRADASVLAPLRESGSQVGCLHPLKAFPRVLPTPSEAVGTVFALEGEPAARALAERLAIAWRGIPVEVTADRRPLYHLAATLAAGGIVTLLASACELSDNIGLPPQVADGYLELARGALRQIESGEGVASAITGPVARGDLEGFKAQVDKLRSLDPDLADLVEALARRTLHHCDPPPRAR